MSTETLIAVLEGQGDEQVEAIERQTDQEVARLRQEHDAAIARLEAEAVAAGQQAVAAAVRPIRAAAEREERRQRSECRQELNLRLHRLAAAMLDELRDTGYPERFAALAGELPEAAWQRITVNPEDRQLAARLLPGAEIVGDPAIRGGLVAATADGRVEVDNTFGKRLERVWEPLLAALFAELEEGDDAHP